MIREAEVVALAATLGEQLKRKNWMCATAESCTGGLIGHLITETPGCSAYFAGGGIVYSYPAKERVLGVLHETLMSEGAVSEAVAQQMAQGGVAFVQCCGCGSCHRNCWPRWRLAR